MLDSATIPAITSLFAHGACADHSRPAFPSITAASHAALWTGVWGDVNGIVSNSQSILPRNEHTLAESRSGFEYAALRAEPLFYEPFFAALPTDHPLTKNKNLKVCDIMTENLMLLDEGHCLREQALSVCGTGYNNRQTIAK